MKIMATLQAVIVVFLACAVGDRVLEWAGITARWTVMMPVGFCMGWNMSRLAGWIHTGKWQDIA